MIFDESVPIHARGLMQAIKDLEALFPAHLNHLAEGSKEDHFPEKETVFMRAGVTLLTSAWEAFVEDLAMAGLSHLMIHCKLPEDLPTDLQRNVSKELKKGSSCT